jgi:Spy/CpxP family protein refolding chaperone
LVYEVGLPNGEIAGIIRARETAQQELKAAEKALGVFRCERMRAEDRLEAAIDKVMPEAEKESSYRRERYEAIQKVLQPKQELERQQREQERQRERELRRGRGRGMER